MNFLNNLHVKEVALVHGCFAIRKANVGLAAHLIVLLSSSYNGLYYSFS
jgi:hypothetical protein